MSLGFPTSEARSTSEILPYLKWNTQTGSLFRIARVRNASGSYDRDETSISLPTKMVFDMANIEAGWLAFINGAPDFHLVKVGSTMPNQPSEEHNKAFRVRVHNKEIGWCEFSSNAKTVVAAMETLHNAYEAELNANVGNMPVVEIAGSDTIKLSTSQGEKRFKALRWHITAWVPANKVPPITPAAADSEEDDDLF